MDITMPSFASRLSFSSLPTLCRLALPAIVAWPCLAAAGNSDPVDANETSLTKNLPKVRAFFTNTGDNSQALHADHATSDAANPPRVVFTMHADVSPQASMLFERSRVSQLGAPGVARVDNAPATRVGFEFRPVSAANALKPIGALRVQVSDNSTLSFRPRRGGVLVSWRSQF